MSTKTVPNTGVATLGRILREGYGPGAWHGADFKAAIADVSDATAFSRPGPERHNIAEIAVHHASCVHNVRYRLTGGVPEPFALAGDDWFPVPDESTLPWKKIAALVDSEQAKLAGVVSALDAGGESPLGSGEQLDLVLGITGHAIYHAGQVQLIKKML
jgi:DinB family protein